MIHGKKDIEKVLERCAERVATMRENAKSKRVGGFMDLLPLAQAAKSADNPTQLPHRKLEG